MIKDIADDINIRGTVKNIDDGSVLVVCETDHDKIEKLVNQIRTSTKPAVIKDIRIEEGSPTTNMKGFKVLLGDANTEILTAMRGGLRLLGKIGNTQDEIKTTQDEMKLTQDEMKLTQDETKGAVKSIDTKMDSSLKNDAQILDTLKDVRDGRLVRATE